MLEGSDTWSLSKTCLLLTLMALVILSSYVSIIGPTRYWLL